MDEYTFGHQPTGAVAAAQEHRRKCLPVCGQPTTTPRRTLYLPDTRSRINLFTTKSLREVCCVVPRLLGVEERPAACARGDTHKMIAKREIAN